ncbi:MAG: redox-regulated ATPase YchF [Chloroflexota bacterium]|nr:redox-regulated ATPase YchF [Chloroflexota bacterium]MDE2947672.1 redox-regulated ATPase YchF [Chloroflexota bacterium]
MSLSIGIVGLPNVGKSTLFNALTRAQNAVAANYPFSTVEANHAVLPLPDERLNRLGAWVGVEQAISARVDFVDVAGLVKGAHKGEGLGNRFLGRIRHVDAIAHVVRCFDDENVVHVNATPQPADDIAVINTELALADLQQLERRLEKLEREVKGDPKLAGQLEMARRVEAFVGAGRPLRDFEERDNPDYVALDFEMRFLTGKPIIYVANIGEDDLQNGNAWLESARAIAAAEGAQLIAVCAGLEQELASLSDDERAEYISMVGLRGSSLERLISESYRLLGLISYFTYNENEVRAWTIRRGWTAPQAAGVVHSDMERGFIRAEVIPFAVFERHQDRNAIKAAGLLQAEGRDYVVQDGDVILFRFNV